MIEILLILFIIGLVIAIAVPNLFRARDTAQARSCIENLTRIEGMKQQWGAENRKDDQYVPDPKDLEPYFKSFPACPAGGAYSCNPVGMKAACTIPGHTL